MCMINELIHINKLFKGEILNLSSLKFAIEEAENKEWRIKLALIMRSLIIDHPFLDGNKRTARYVLIKQFNKEKIPINEDKINRMITKIAINNITNIIKIKRLIENATR